jgi:hypothetical protein
MSIYNDDIAIRNTIKGNTMSNKNNNTQGFAALSAGIIADGVEEIANNLDISIQERDLILEAAARVRDQSANVDVLNDWQNSALSATDERDRLRVREAELEAKIDLLNARVRDLERCVVQNALDSAMLRRRDQEESTEKIIFHAGRVVQNEIDWERHNDETSLENGAF